MSGKYLIAGLGNPTAAYVDTRHNIGFSALELLARVHKLEFRARSKCKASIACGSVGSRDAILMMPATYMNLSGEAVAPYMRNNGIALSNLLVLVDDVAIPFGHLRLRAGGGSGGHNGMKSIEEHLGSNEFARLRIGVGAPEEGDLASFVLGRFSQSEKLLLPKILERAVRAVEIWLEKGLNHAMDFANRNPSNPCSGD